MKCEICAKDRPLIVGHVVFSFDNGATETTELSFQSCDSCTRKIQSRVKSLRIMSKYIEMLERKIKEKQ